MIKLPETNLVTIAAFASVREEENEVFRDHLSFIDRDHLDTLVHDITKRVTASIDCTDCGACCKSLMINVTDDNITPVAQTLNLSVSEFKNTYIEQSTQGQMIMNTIPCKFLQDNKCSVYADRFTECRDFPHLHKPNFSGRIGGTLMYYGMCPIIYNVIEELKLQTEFIHDN